MREQCGRILSALLPAAEVLMRNVMDLRLEHWQQCFSHVAGRDVVVQARCVAMQTFGWKCSASWVVARGCVARSAKSVREVALSTMLSTTLLARPGVTGKGRKSKCDAQSVALGAAVVRLVSREDDRLAGLALISTIRKRLSNLPADCASDELWRVRMPQKEWLKTGSCTWFLCDYCLSFEH